MHSRPYDSVYLWFDRKLTHEQSWARTWSPDTFNYDFYDLSNIREGWRERPSLIASNIIYSHRATHLSDEEIRDITFRELAECVPAAADARILHTDIHRIPMAIPCPHPGTENLRPSTHACGTGLLLAGDWTRTQFPASMESAVCSGFLAAEQIWKDLGQERRLAKAPRPTEGIAGLVRRLSHIKTPGRETAGSSADAPRSGRSP